MIQKRTAIAVLGVLSILLGVFNFGGLMSTIIIDTTPPMFSTTGSYPSSTELATPSIITQLGTATDFWIVTRDINGIQSVSLVCTSTDGSYSSGTIVATKGTSITLSGVVWDVYKWSAPVLAAGKLYKFVWTAKDVAGHTATITTYGGYGDADGYFTINGIRVLSTTQVVVLSSPTLNIQFTATVTPENIVRIDVKIKNSAGTIIKQASLTKVSDTQYSTDNFHTFTADGSYVIEGYIVMSTKSNLKMSIYSELGDVTAGGDILGFSTRQLLFLGLGVVMLVYSRRIKAD